MNNAAGAFGAPDSLAWTAEEQALIAADAMPEGAFADRLLEQLRAAPALLTEEEIGQFGKRLRTDLTHRLALIFLGMSGEELCRRIEQNRDFALAATGACRMAKEEIVPVLTALLDLIDEVDRRVFVALCLREDMEQVITEGEAMREAP